MDKKIIIILESEQLNYLLVQACGPSDSAIGLWCFIT